MTNELNIKHKAFADEYLNNGRNATKAYMSVYKPLKISGAEASAARLLGTAKVQTYIAKVDLDNAETKGITKKKYLDFMDSLVSQARVQGEIDTSKIALDAIKIIGKWEGFEAPDKKQDVDKNGNPVDPIQNITITIKDNTNES